MPGRRTLLLLAAVLLGGQGGPPAADAPVPPGTSLPRPTASFRDRTEAGLPVRLDVYTDDTPAFVAFRLEEAPSPAKAAPLPEEEGRLVGHLLGQAVAAGLGLPVTFRFALDTFTLVAVLRQRLAEPDAN